MRRYVGNYNGISPVSAFAYDVNGGIWNGAAYVAPVDAAIVTYRIAIDTDDSGSLYADIPDNAVRSETRVDGTTFPLSELIWGEPLPIVFDAAWATYVTTQLALIGASSANPPLDATTLFAEPLEAYTSNRYVKSITFPGVAFTGWTKISFTIKQRYKEDDDNEALLLVRKTNPADAATDGIIYHSRNAIDPANTLRGKASIAVTATAPDAAITITLNAEALDLLPSPETDPYEYEINLWKGGDKELIGKNSFKLMQSVLRETVAP